MNYNNPETKPRKPRKKRTHFPLGSHRGAEPLPLYFSEMRYISSDDWQMLFEEFDKRFLDDPRLTQKRFCEEKEISPKLFSANYAKHKPKAARRGVCQDSCRLFMLLFLWIYLQFHYSKEGSTRLFRLDPSF